MARQEPAGVPPLKWSTNWDRVVPFQEDQRMVGKRYKPEEIVSKLRQIEVIRSIDRSIWLAGTCNSSENS